MLKNFVSKFLPKKTEDINVKIKEEKSVVAEVKEEAITITINLKPKICCIDIDEKDIESLKLFGFNIEASGTLGSKVSVPNKNNNDNVQVLPNHDFPNNLHEFDITIIDQDNAKTIEYNQDDHIRSNHTGMKENILLSEFPETIFDPRPLGSKILGIKLNKLGDKKHLIINFTTEKYNVDYQPIEVENGHYSRGKIFKYNIFDFNDSIDLSYEKEGKEVNVCVKNEQLKNFLNKYISGMTYSQTFNHPTDYDNGTDSNHIPLIKNTSNDIVSILIFDKNKIIFHFPQVKDNGKFLNDFFTQVAPSLFPELFPNATAFKWRDDENYWLPNHQNLLEEKKSLKREYEQNLSMKNTLIEDNLDKYSFLHSMLTESSDELVKALIQFFEWLEFDDVRDVDEDKSEDTILEEDIQVELSNGLLIIECKGIGGTSKDSECSQVSKIKHRRCKERNKFDVYALYIVNHQRYLPPLNRENPPFTKHQIQDAKHDERGLVTTWQLFNLYTDIENEIITKEEARSLLLEYGLVEFKPQNLVFIDEPKELFRDGEVCIVNIENIDISIGETLYVEKNNKYEKVIIEEIKLDGKTVKDANTGELGLKLNKAIKKKSKLYKKNILRIDTTIIHR